MNTSVGYVIAAAAVYVLAVARLTRVVNLDFVADPLRLFIARRANAAKQAADEAVTAGQPATTAVHERSMARWNTAAYFFNCPWCVSVWLAAATAWVPLYHAHNPIAVYIGVTLAVSHLIGIAAALADDEDIIVEKS